MNVNKYMFVWAALGALAYVIGMWLGPLGIASKMYYHYISSMPLLKCTYIFFNAYFYTFLLASLFSFLLVKYTGYLLVNLLVFNLFVQARIGYIFISAYDPFLLRKFPISTLEGFLYRSLPLFVIVFFLISYVSCKISLKWVVRGCSQSKKIKQKK